MSFQPKLVFDSDPGDPRFGCIRVRHLPPDLVSFLQGKFHSLLQSILRVKVTEPVGAGVDELPDVSGNYQVLERALRFTPYFPFESGIRYRASFDLRPLGRNALTDILTLEFSFPSRVSTMATHVVQVFPSDDLLPENLLRFYIRFSNSMQRGRAEQEISLLGPGGRPAPDVLYRPPVELWDRSMRHLTILLDPGRLKRGVGPNRELGPPLKTGLDYTLVVGSGMRDVSGRSLSKRFYKTFCVAEPVREPIEVNQWVVVAPGGDTRHPLVLVFPRPLDWALLLHTITVASEGGRTIPGRIAIDQCEKRWSFTPSSPWVAGLYKMQVESTLEDVCGNTVAGPFDRPLSQSTHPAEALVGSDGSSPIFQFGITVERKRLEFEPKSLASTNSSPASTAGLTVG